MCISTKCRVQARTEDLMLYPLWFACLFVGVNRRACLQDGHSSFVSVDTKLRHHTMIPSNHDRRELRDRRDHDFRVPSWHRLPLRGDYEKRDSKPVARRAPVLEAVVRCSIVEPIASTWSSSFAFTLTPVIGVDRIDIVESKFVELEEEVRREQSHSPTITEFELAAAIELKKKNFPVCKWKDIASFSFSVDGSQIRALRSGTYLAIVHLMCFMPGLSHTTFVGLRQGSHELFRHTVYYYSGYGSSTFLQWVVHLKRGESLEFFGDHWRCR